MAHINTNDRSYFTTIWSVNQKNLNHEAGFVFQIKSSTINFTSVTLPRDINQEIKPK